MPSLHELTGEEVEALASSPDPVVQGIVQDLRARENAEFFDYLEELQAIADD